MLTRSLNWNERPYVVVEIDHAATRTLSTRLSHVATWFQLVKIWVTNLKQYISGRLGAGMYCSCSRLATRRLLGTNRDLTLFLRVVSWCVAAWC
jgi:hypothetical protein